MKHIKGDIFTTDADAILHQVNCQGVMGAGLAKQIKEKYPTVFKYYKARCDADKEARKRLVLSKSNLLGLAQICYKEDYRVGQVEDTQVIVNCFAQDRYGRDGRCYTDYAALKKCFEYVNQRFAGKKVAIPYLMGCGLAGGDWKIVSELIKNTLVDCDVTLYEYSKERKQVTTVEKLVEDAKQRTKKGNTQENNKNDFVIE